MKTALLVFSILTSGAFAVEADHKVFFDKLVKMYGSKTSKAAKISDFKAREQVWHGECVNAFHLPELTYVRDEYYLPVIRHKTAPGEEPEVQFASIDVGGNPYSSKHIDEPADAIWFLRGDAGVRISLAEHSEEHDALVADYYDTQEIRLKAGKWEGKKVYFLVLIDEKKQIVKACYFDEKVL